MPSLTGSIARLYRAGDEHSRAWVKLCKATDDLIFWLGAHVPECVSLPGNCQIRRLSNAPDRYELKGAFLTLVTGESKKRHDLLSFCELITKHSWLDEVSIWFEGWSRQYQVATNTIESALAKIEEKHPS